MRRRAAERNEVLPDKKYNSHLVARFVNMVMDKGKKSVSENIVYGAFEILKQRTQEEDALKVFNKAIDNARPRLEVRPRRVGGATYQIPMEVPVARGNAIVMRWIRDFARAKKGKPMRIKLADELFAAYKSEGPAIKKRDDSHKMAEANRAFAHLRW